MYDKCLDLCFPETVAAAHDSACTEEHQAVARQMRQKSEVRVLGFIKKILASVDCTDTLLMGSPTLEKLAQNIVETVKQNKNLQLELIRHKHALDQHAIVSKTDKNGKIVEANELFCSMSGYSHDELVGADHKLVKSEMHASDFWDEVWEVVNSGRAWHGEVCNRHKSGSLYWVKLTIVPFFDLHGDIQEYIAIRTDITERKKVEAALQAAKEAAELANQAKTDFLARMSHEIRTPLNAMLGLTQMLERTHLDDEQREVVQRIDAAGQVLLRNLNDVLDFSKIEAGQMSLRPHDFCMGQVLNNLYKMQYSVAHAAGLSLSLDMPECDFYVRGDDIRLSQILLNLTNNAIKFTPKGSVNIQARLLDKEHSTCRFRFEVTDSGMGIPANKIQTLFQPFTQVDNGATRRFGGTGLGLSICRSLTDLMGGHIGVNSVEGVGSTFWFELPFAVVTDQKVAVPRGGVTPRKSTPHPTKRLQDKKILVVDDNEMNRYMVQHVLSLEGARTSVAVNGQEAVDILAAEPDSFDAVLMDIQMPVMDGLEATRLIRTSLGLTRLPLIICSAGVQSEDRDQAMAAGANEFMTKPIQLDVLADALHQTMAEKAQTAIPVVTDSADPDSLWTDIPGIDGMQVHDQLDGDVVSYQMMLELFVQEIKNTLYTLPEELKRGDLGAAQARLHKLRGGAGSLYAHDLVEACAMLEGVLKNKDLPMLSSSLAFVMQQMRHLVRTIDVVLEKRQDT